MLYTRPLVTPLTRPLIGKVLKQFDPLSNDPYLLFDAETSMLGELESPTLDLDASDPATLEVITATRSGVATFTDQAGVIQEAEPNTVRVDWSLGYPAMLIEPSATNFVTYSISFVEFSGAIRVEGIDAPDGSNDANRISNAQAVANNFVRCATTTVPTGSAIELSGSVYVRGVAGETVRVNMKRVTAGPYVASPTQTVVLTGDWQRVENLTLTTDPANDRMAIYFNSAGATADTIDVWGAQIEEGVVSTSIIPTSGGSVAERTRNADNLVIDGTAFSDFYNQTEGTFYVEAEYDYMASSYLEEDQYIFDASDNSGNNRLLMYGNSGFTTLSMYIRSGGAAGTSSTSATTINTGELFRAALTYRDNSQELFTNGDNGVSLTYTPTPSVTRMSIGARWTFINHMKGRIKRLLYWPTHSSSL